jgi:hypothetical protein
MPSRPGSDVSPATPGVRRSHRRAHRWRRAARSSKRLCAKTSLRSSTIKKSPPSHWQTKREGTLPFSRAASSEPFFVAIRRHRTAPVTEPLWRPRAVFSGFPSPLQKRSGNIPIPMRRPSPPAGQRGKPGQSGQHRLISATRREVAWVRTAWSSRPISSRRMSQRCTRARARGSSAQPASRNSPARAGRADRFSGERLHDQSHRLTSNPAGSSAISRAADRRVDRRVESAALLAPAKAPGFIGRLPARRGRRARPRPGRGHAAAPPRASVTRLGGDRQQIGATARCRRLKAGAQAMPSVKGRVEPAGGAKPRARRPRAARKALLDTRC